MTKATEADILAVLQKHYDELVKKYEGGISNTSNVKYRPMQIYLTEELGLGRDDAYFTGAATRTTNFEVRLSQGRQATKATVLGVCFGVHEPGELSKWADACMNTADKFMGRGKANYEAILFVGIEDEQIAFGAALVKAGSRLGPLLAERLPGVRQRLAAAVSAVSVVPQTVTVPPSKGPQDPIAALEKESLGLVRRVAEAAINHHNVVLQGPPGTGKTFIARAVAETIIDNAHVKDGDYREVQFHQSYSYEDFVQGFRPTRRGGYAVRPGAFLDLCRNAIEAPDCNYVMLVDEFNRGNVSQILGELMSLIEADKREATYAKHLLYSTPKQDPFYVPNNVYFIGMMNTADRSLALMDFALRRRFVFFDVEPIFGEEYLRMAARRGVPDELSRKISDRCIRLNDRIAGDYRFLGPGHRIGHAYFLPPSVPSDPLEWFRSVVHSQVGPLLREYWHDRPDVAAEEIGALLA